MFCKWCGKYAFVRGGPIAQHGCPVCDGSFFGGQEKVSRDDDSPSEDRSSSHDEDSPREYRASPVDVSYSSDDSASSEYSSSASGSTYASDGTGTKSDATTGTVRGTVNAVIIGAGVLVWLYEVIDIWRHSSGFDGFGLFALINGIGGILNVVIGGTVMGFVIGLATSAVFIVVNFLLNLSDEK